jgi:hypothetical protein
MTTLDAVFETIIDNAVDVDAMLPTESEMLHLDPSTRIKILLAMNHVPHEEAAQAVYMLPLDVVATSGLYVWRTDDEA